VARPLPGRALGDGGDFRRAMTARAGHRRRVRRLVVAAVITLLGAGLAVVGSFWRRSVREVGQREAAQLLALGRFATFRPPQRRPRLRDREHRAQRQPTRASVRRRGPRPRPPALFLLASRLDGPCVECGRGTPRSERQCGPRAREPADRRATQAQLDLRGHGGLHPGRAPARDPDSDWHTPGPPHLSLPEGRLERTVEIGLRKNLYPPVDDHLPAVEFDPSVPEAERSALVRRHLSSTARPTRCLGALGRPA